MTQLWRVDTAHPPAFTGDGALHLADRREERRVGLRESLRSHEIRWLAGLGIVTLCSWARWLATGSPKIDQNYPSAAAGTLLLVALCAGWALTVIGWAGMLARPPERPRRLAYLGLLAVVPMLPLLSNDVFSLFAQASLSSQGRDVYATASAYRDSVWFGWIGERWRSSPSPYGPLTLLASWPSAYGGGNPWLAEIFLKVAWLLPLVAVIELSVRAFPNRSMFHTMLWLNPLFLVEGLGQLHPDLLGVLLVTVGLMLARRSRTLGAGVTWSLATVAKLNFGLAAPWFLLSGTRGWSDRMRRTLVVALTLAATATILYTPFWRGPETVLGQLQGLRTNTFVPGGTMVDVVGTAAGGLAGSKANTPVELFDPRQQDVRTRAAQGAQLLAMLIALAAIIPLGLGLLRDLDEDRLALATGAFIVAMVTLASPKFQSWYLMTALPFFALCCPPEWRRWWVWAVATAVAPEFALVLPRSAFLFTPWALTTLASVVVFLLSFRARFWTLAPRAALIRPWPASPPAAAAGRRARTIEQ